MNDDRPGNHWRRVRQGLDEAVRGWLYDPNVRYIDYGFPEKDTELRLDDEPHIRVHVVRKFQQGPALEAATGLGITRGEIPDQFAGIPVDRPQSSYRPHQPPWSAGGWTPGGTGIFSQPVNLRTRRTAPLRGGISVSDQYRRIAGTLGGPVVDRRTGALMLLSNWHVLSGVSGRLGWSIYQPGRGDGGGMADRVATLERDAMAASLDAAVATLTDARAVVNQPWGLPAVRGFNLAQLGMSVEKSGRTTGVTRGIVTGVNGTQRMYYAGAGYRVIRRVISITPGDAELSRGGDSGSFWIEEGRGNVVALHFAGNQPSQPEEALAIDIEPILDALEVDLHV